MNRVLLVLIILISVFSVSYSVEKFKPGQKQERVRYISKYNTNLDDSIIECYYDLKDNTFNYMKNNVIIKKYFYKTKEDFILERRNFGTFRAVSLTTLNQKNIEMKSYHSYDSELRHLQEKGEKLVITYKKWDSRKRGIKADVIITGVSDDVQLEVVFDDKTKTGYSKFIYPDGLLDRFPGLPVEFVHKCDEYNNELSVAAKFKNGHIREIVTNVISYADFE